MGERESDEGESVRPREGRAPIPASAKQVQRRSERNALTTGSFGEPDDRPSNCCDNNLAYTDNMHTILDLEESSSHGFDIVVDNYSIVI